MAQDDFFSKSKEDLSAIAVAFNLVSADQASAMSQSELAGLLAAEQQKSSGTPVSFTIGVRLYNFPPNLGRESTKEFKTLFFAPMYKKFTAKVPNCSFTFNKSANA